MLGARPSPASLSTWIARCATSPARWYSRCLTAARRLLEGASVCPCRWCRSPPSLSCCPAPALSLPAAAAGACSPASSGS
eukprot:1390791-Lingulodinium_polyedra.AAC.1